MRDWATQFELVFCTEAHAFLNSVIAGIPIERIYERNRDGTMGYRSTSRCKPVSIFDYLLPIASVGGGYILSQEMRHCRLKCSRCFRRSPWSSLRVAGWKTSSSQFPESICPSPLERYHDGVSEDPKDPF
ncbi:unnamed protein product [Caenorhabditis auriculariae]|uniref:Uncharacterized protein n=1 Tax=Caenorhabditis auriculariae TaxID=2777116 RepID=A0A8S1HIN1_9PELO|nr:unnamed protein product [Caenorhabditis auriculariae]